MELYEFKFDRYIIYLLLTYKRNINASRNRENLRRLVDSMEFNQGSFMKYLYIIIKVIHNPCGIYSKHISSTNYVRICTMYMRYIFKTN